MDNISVQTSQKFRLVSTLSMIAVVFIHAKFIMSRWGTCMDTDTMMGRISDIVQFSISEILCRLAVPIFFLISGFFMAYHNDGSIQTYISKIKSRVKSLLVPYLIFSIIWVAISMFTGQIEISNVMDFILYIFISPIPFQFWFLQHLMILVLLSVLLYKLIKRFGILSMTIMGIIYMFDNDLRTGFGGSLFYYGMGMSWCLCINSLTEGALIHKNLFISAFTILFIACILARLFEFDVEYTLYCIANKVMIFCGVCWLMWWILFDKSPFNTPKWMAISSGTSFLIFCLHEPLLSFLKSMYLHIFSAQYEIFVGYFILPTVAILLCLTVDHIVKRANLKLYKILTGGR